MTLAPLTDKQKTLLERARAPVDYSKCLARAWNGIDWEKGIGVQCSRNTGANGCLCSQHQRVVDKDGSWFLGMVTEPRPEHPFKPDGKGGPHFGNGHHVWKTSPDGQLYTDEEYKHKIKERKAMIERGERVPQEKKGTHYNQNLFQYSF